MQALFTYSRNIRKHSKSILLEVINNSYARLFSNGHLILLGVFSQVASGLSNASSVNKELSEMKFGPFSLTPENLKPF